MRKFSPDQVDQILEQIVCRHPGCLKVLSRKNTTGFCVAHAQAYSGPGGRQQARKGAFGIQATLMADMYDELVWLAERDGCTLADKIRETLEWGLNTLDLEDRMPRNDGSFTNGHDPRRQDQGQGQKASR